MNLPRSSFYLYILDGHTPVATEDALAWSAMFSDLEKRVVGHDELPNGVRVSTVFIGMPLGTSFMVGPPLLFESMIFGGPEDGYQDRCATWEEAERMHAAAVTRAWAAALSPPTEDKP